MTGAGLESVFSKYFFTSENAISPGSTLCISLMPVAESEASPITYESAPPADVLAEDKVIECFPLGVLREDVRVVPVAEVFAK